jgi:hypothetical protein
VSPADAWGIPTAESPEARPAKEDDIQIRDVSAAGAREWVPPIGAMGGPPAHELYRDLVVHAGLRLFRDGAGNPCVAMRDGEHRRTFVVPSDELREALDRFRMRRNMRPVPEHDLAELTRIVQARVSDPDILIPTFDVGETPSNRPEAPVRPRIAPTPAPVSGIRSMDQELDAILRAVDEVRLPVASHVPQSKAPSAWNEVVSHSAAVPPMPAPLVASISGGRMLAAAPPGLPRYLEALRGLVRNGGWLGTTSELSHLTGDDPQTVFASLMKYRSDLAGNNIVIAPVETQEGWRWLAVDRSRLYSAAETSPASSSESGTDPARGD